MIRSDGDPSGLINSQVIGDAIQGNMSFPANPVISKIVQVGINLSSASGSTGWNGDLYAYLRYDSGNGVGFTTLLNRVGTTTGNPIGYTTSGMNVYFDRRARAGERGAGDIRRDRRRNQAGAVVVAAARGGLPLDLVADTNYTNWH